MKKFIGGLVFAVLSVPAFAGGEYTSLRFPVAATLTPTNSVTVTNTANYSGQAKSITVALTGGSATVRVTTVAGVGSTVGSAKTVWGPTVVTVAGIATNIADGVFLDGDELVARYDNAAITSSVTSIKTVVFTER